MAIDLKKMRAKLEAMQSKGKGSSNWWKPSDGEQSVRIVPTPDGDPFKEHWFHYNVGNNPGFLSPYRNFNEADPLNDFVRQLFNEGTEESIKQAKNLMARQRFFSPVLVRGEEDQGVRLWGYGKTVYEQLLNLVLNPEYGDITDVEVGTDLTLQYGKPAGATYPQTKLVPRRRSSPLCDDAVGGDERCTELLETIPDFDSIFERKTPEEVGAMLDAYLLGETADSVAQELTSTTTTAATTTTDTASSVDAAFNELMGS